MQLDVAEQLYAVAVDVDGYIEIEFYWSTSVAAALLKHSKFWAKTEVELLEALDTEKTLNEITVEELKELMFESDGAVDIKKVTI